MRFTIQRSKWLRGEGGAVSRLLRYGDNKMCCMGQVAAQCGCSHDELLGVENLHLVRDTLERFGPLRLVQDSGGSVGIWSCDWVSQAYGINDRRDLSDPEREQQLSALAAANGHEMVFVD